VKFWIRTASREVFQLTRLYTCKDIAKIACYKLNTVVTALKQRGYCKVDRLTLYVCYLEIILLLSIVPYDVKQRMKTDYTLDRMPWAQLH